MGTIGLGRLYFDFTGTSRLMIVESGFFGDLYHIRVLLKLFFLKRKSTKNFGKSCFFLIFLVTLQRKLILMQDLKEATSYRIALKDRIMEAAMMLFRERGIKAVKMDDIAQHLGISKRTLYEIYEDKEKLLYYCIVTYDRRRHAYMENYVNEGHNVIDVIVEAYRMKLKETRTVCPLFYEDIMKYPQVEQYLKDEHERMRDGFVRFMQRGVEEGFLRSEINYQLVPHLLDATGQYVMNNQMLKKYPADELFDNLFLVSLRGLCTMKGYQVLEEAIATKIR